MWPEVEGVHARDLLTSALDAESRVAAMRGGAGAAAGCNQARYALSSTGLGFGWGGRLGHLRVCGGLRVAFAALVFWAWLRH